VSPSATGHFNQILGEIHAITEEVLTGESMYLGVRVGTDAEMSPRSELVSSPYAMRVATVDGSMAGALIGPVTIQPGDEPPALFIQGAGSEGVMLAPSEGDILRATNGLGDDAIAIGYGLDGGGAVSFFGSDGKSGITATQEAMRLDGGGLHLFGTSEADTLVSIEEGNITLRSSAKEAAGARVQIGQNGLYFLDATMTDTTMIVSADGSIYGQGRIAMGQNVTAAGTYSNALGFNNSADGDSSVVSGGYSNRADGVVGTVGGGAWNSASGWYSTIGGGMWNTASDFGCTVSGGLNNSAGGNAYNVVPGGRYNAASGYVSFAAGYRAKASHSGSFVWADYNNADFVSTATNQFSVRATGGVRFVSAIDGAGVPTAGVSLAAGGGSWQSISDRNLKRNFSAVSGISILEKIAAMPITTWNYRAQDESIRHIGPMAQDFYAAFGVGEDDKHISTVDADGVALAAIKELYSRNRVLEAEVAELQRLVSELSKSR
jgi:hypothetical protein